MIVHITTLIIATRFTLKTYETTSGINKQKLRKDLEDLNTHTHPSSLNAPKSAPLVWSFGKFKGGARLIISIILGAHHGVSLLVDCRVPEDLQL